MRIQSSQFTERFSSRKGHQHVKNNKEVYYYHQRTNYDHSYTQNSVLPYVYRAAQDPFVGLNPRILSQPCASLFKLDRVFAA